MQLSIGWHPAADLSHSRRHAQAVAVQLATHLHGVKVFKASRDFVLMIAVTMTYWFVSAMMWQPILFPLVRGVHQWQSLRLILMILGLIGVFVIANEPARALFAGHASALKPAALVLVGLLSFTTVAYWTSQQVFVALTDLAAEIPCDLPVCTASNFVLLAMNVILPGLGAAFLMRLARHALQPHKAASRVR